MKMHSWIPEKFSGFPEKFCPLGAPAWGCISGKRQTRSEVPRGVTGTQSEGVTSTSAFGRNCHTPPGHQAVSPEQAQAGRKTPTSSPNLQLPK